MAAPLRLTLTGLEVIELEEARDSDPRPYVRVRSAALLKIADSQSGRQIALHGLLRPRQPDTVYNWVKRYKTDGFEGLLIKPGRGRKPVFAAQHLTTRLADDWSGLQNLVGCFLDQFICGSPALLRYVGLQDLTQ